MFDRSSSKCGLAALQNSFRQWICTKTNGCKSVSRMIPCIYLVTYSQWPFDLVYSGYPQLCIWPNLYCKCQPSSYVLFSWAAEKDLLDWFTWDDKLHVKSWNVADFSDSGLFIVNDQDVICTIISISESSVYL